MPKEFMFIYIAFILKFSLLSVHFIIICLLFDAKFMNYTLKI